jgi:hypothetical protein
MTMQLGAMRFFAGKSAALSQVEGLAQNVGGLFARSGGLKRPFFRFVCRKESCGLGVKSTFRHSKLEFVVIRLLCAI